MKLSIALSAFLVSSAFAGTVRKAGGGKCQSIASIACGTDGFETLCELVKQVGLDTVLDGKDVFTVFAPTNEAFKKLPADLDSMDSETLTDLLLFHAVAGKEVYGDDLVCQELLEMANGVDSRTFCDGGERYQKGAGNPDERLPHIEEADIPACNGIVHIIDDVMLPRKIKNCDKGGFSRFPHLGLDNSQRMLLREGVISEIPPKLCPQDREMNNITKNVILVIGDGMGWEMIRAGAIAKRVIEELGELGCDTKSGECPDDLKEAAKSAFEGRTTADYYTEGKGSGLSFQIDALDFMLVTTSAPLLQMPNPGNHYAPAASLLAGSVTDHDPGQAPLALNECGFPIDFDPRDWLEGGHMVLWDNVKGGEFPWDERYYQENPDTSDGFDPTFIMQHATDSANTAGTLATGHKAAVNMMSQTLYEEDVSTLVEDAMMCSKAGGVVSSVPVFHATPGAFIIHTNDRNNRDSLRRSFERVNPTFVSGACGGDYYPYPETLESMRSGARSSQWILLEQSEEVMAEDFYSGERFTEADPDNGDHVLVCLGGDFTASGESNLPYRGVDSSYGNRYCSSGEALIDDDSGAVIGVNLTTPEELCNHYEPEEIAHIPPMAKNVKAALDFLSKDDDGFFLMYEQGDIDWSAHANHMDDMLGAMLDISDSVQEILDWIEGHGGFAKNALYVTADHDHYLTLMDHFPEVLAHLLIDGKSHMITPKNNSNVNPWDAAIAAGRHEDDSKDQVEDLSDFSTWTDEDIWSVAHFFGPRGSGGNGWGSHSTRPVPLFYAGDDGCLEALLGKGYQVEGRDVAGSPGKVDQVHIHACMQKHLLGFK